MSNRRSDNIRMKNNDHENTSQPNRMEQLIGYDRNNIFVANRLEQLKMARATVV